jgi:CubicO group peptidase (beta-lactamase class C family)
MHRRLPPSTADRTRTLVVSSLLLALGGPWLPLSAQPARAPAPPLEIDSARIGRFIDSVVSHVMSMTGVPGVVVGVVHRGGVLHLKGYGVADLATRTPVDPERTRFRWGSVAKPFTALAVLQLAERGKLDLHADVNRWLRDVKVPADGAPITAHHLLTHIAGLDVRLNGTAAPERARVRPLGRYLAAELPPRVRPPGETFAYSNHGYALLGHLVESLSGSPFEAYVAREVFLPLGMTRTALSHLPDDTTVLATGYLPGRGGYRPAPPMHLNIAPAAGLSSTGRDMTRFALAMLSPGDTLRPPIGGESLERTRSAQFRQDPRMPGVTYGLMESYWGGQRVLLHSGGVHGFISAVYLWPDRQTGLVVADNGFNGALVEDVFLSLSARLFPVRDSTARAPATTDAARYTGFYRSANHPRTSFEKAGAIRNPPARIRAVAPGTLLMAGETFTSVGPRLFRSASGESLAFLEDARGRVTGVVTDYPFAGPVVYERVPFLATRLPHALLFAIAALLALVVLIRPPRPATSAASWTRFVPRVARAIGALTLAVLAFAMASARVGGGAGVFYGVPWPLDVAALLAIPLVALVVALAVAMLGTLRLKEWTRGARGYLFTAVTVFGLFSASLAYWNLLGIHH